MRVRRLRMAGALIAALATAAVVSLTIAPPARSAAPDRVPTYLHQVFQANQNALLDDGCTNFQVSVGIWRDVSDPGGPAEAAYASVEKVNWCSPFYDVPVYASGTLDSYTYQLPMNARYARLAGDVVLTNYGYASPAVSVHVDVTLDTTTLQHWTQKPSEGFVNLFEGSGPVTGTVAVDGVNYIIDGQLNGVFDSWLNNMHV